MDRYEPSELIRGRSAAGLLPPLPCLPQLVTAFREQGCEVFVTYGGEDCEYVNGQNVRMAVCEADESQLVVMLGDLRMGSLYILPDNPEEFEYLADYSWDPKRPVVRDIVERVLGGEV